MSDNQKCNLCDSTMNIKKHDIELRNVHNEYENTYSWNGFDMDEYLDETIYLDVYMCDICWNMISHKYSHHMFNLDVLLSYECFAKIHKKRFTYRKYNKSYKSEPWTVDDLIKNINRYAVIIQRGYRKYIHKIKKAHQDKFFGALNMILLSPPNNLLIDGGIEYQLSKQSFESFSLY